MPELLFFFFLKKKNEIDFEAKLNLISSSKSVVWE